MTFPDDLPLLIEYRCGVTVRGSLPRHPVENTGTSGDTNANEICPQIPFGADAWRLPGEREWRAMDSIPKAWLPHLDRERPSAMDPRPVKQRRKRSSTPDQVQ